MWFSNKSPQYKKLRIINNIKLLNVVIQVTSMIGLKLVRITNKMLKNLRCISLQ